MAIVDILRLVALASLLGAVIADVRRFEIPDSFSIVILATAVVAGLFIPGFGWGWHALAVVVMFAAGLAIFAMGVMGGGDIKLLVAIAAWTGLSGLPMLLVGVALSGGALALALLAVRGGLALAKVAPEARHELFRHRAPLPYALAIAGGAVWWAWPMFGLQA